MEEKFIQERSFQFSLMIIEVYKKLLFQKEFIISKQLFRSGTSIGANVAEAQGGISKREFRNKMSIALKEALEARYWIKLLIESELVEIEMSKEEAELETMINMLYKIVKTSSQTSSIEAKKYTLNTAPILGID